MPHTNKITDKDPCFEIDAITRQIRNVSSTKTTVMQYDHNSERFSFTLPRYIEGHDMMECTKAEVHYLNVDTPGIYTMTDLAVDETDENKVKCTWLLSQNATLKIGVLKFLLRFSCIAEDGTIEYAWSTGVYTQIMVSAGMYNSEEMFKPYSDVLEQLKTVFPGRKTEYGGVIFGDLINNMAAAPFTMTTGSGCIAGMRGYFYSSIEFGEALDSGNYGPCRITLTKSQPSIFADAETPEAFAIGFKVGDVICMVNDSKYPDCATITAIEGNVITVDRLPFNSVKDVGDSLAMDDYSIYVPTKPLAGVVPLGYYAMAVGEDVWVMERASGGIGRNIRIYGQYSFGAGREVYISGYLGFGFGRKLEIGSTCAGFGYNNKIKGGEGSFGSGKNGVIEAPAAHGEGKYYEVTGEAAHAENLYLKVYARGAHGEGYYGLIELGADFAHHEGYRNVIKPTGKNAHIGGKDSETAGEGSFVHGLHLKCNENGIYQWIGGKYNIEDTEGKYALIIGGGTSDKDRRNILTVDWDGNMELAESRAVTEADMSALIATYTAKELAAGITSEIGVKFIYDEDEIDSFSIVVDETVVVDKTPVTEKARIATELLKAEKTRFVFYAGEEKVYTAAVKNTLPNRGMLFITE